MRLWSIHPKYLDSKGLVALWRETLLAKKVLENKTSGYRHHPQLERFKNASAPLDCINQYLQEIYFEAQRRNYSFDQAKINWKIKYSQIQVTTGQIEFEFVHLKNKLKIRDPKRYREINLLQKIEPHPIFILKKGKRADWEKSS